MTRLVRWAVTIAVVVMLDAGCGAVDTVPLYDEVPPPVRVDSGGGADALSALDRDLPVAVPPGTKFFTAADAKECPTVKVMDFQGEKMKVQFGQPGFVTIVVFWSMEWPGGKTAARHVADLQRKYAAHGVRAIGVALRTAHLNAAQSFAQKQRLNYRLFVDDLSALKKLAGAAGADEKKAVPAFFIVDRRMRLRFYRPGFLFAIGGAGTPGILGQSSLNRDSALAQVGESLPVGQRIEDYLRRILDEG